MKSNNFDELFLEENSDNLIDDLSEQAGMSIDCLTMWLTCINVVPCGNSTKEACDYFNKYCT